MTSIHKLGWPTCSLASQICRRAGLLNCCHGIGTIRTCRWSLDLAVMLYAIRGPRRMLSLEDTDIGKDPLDQVRHDSRQLLWPVGVWRLVHHLSEYLSQLIEIVIVAGLGHAPRLMPPGRASRRSVGSGLELLASLVLV